MPDPEPLSDEWFRRYEEAIHPDYSKRTHRDIAAAALEWVSDQAIAAPATWGGIGRLCRAKAREIREGV